MILTLLACTGSVTPVGTSFEHPLIDAVRDGIEGFDIEEGRFQVFDDAACDALVAAGSTCLGNNADSPYVTLAFDDLDAPVGSFQLAPDEAIVLVGQTPPPSLYHGLNVALYQRSYGGEFRVTAGSLTGSIHHRNLLASETFGGDTVVVVAANRTVAQQVRRGLTPLLDDSEVDGSVVNMVPLPYLTEAALARTLADPAYVDITVDPLQMGRGPDDDRYLLTWRVVGADPTDPFFDPDTLPQGAFRMTPLAPPAPDPWAYPQFPPLRDPSNVPPATVGEGLRALADALVADHPGRQALRLRFNESVLDGFACNAAGTPCGSSDDALYSASARVVLPEASVDARVYAIGAVHPDLPDLGGGPPLAYSSLNLQDSVARRSLASWLHPALRGTARERFPGGLSGVPSEVFDRLYVVEVSRACSHPACITPDGLGPDAPLGFLERSYLDLATGTGPHPDVITDARLVMIAPTVVPDLIDNVVRLR